MMHRSGAGATPAELRGRGIRATSLDERAVRSSLRLGTFLLVITSGVALFLTQKLWISSSILIAVTLYALLFVRQPRGSSFWEIASFVYLIFFFVDWAWITQSIAPSLVHLFIFIIINKLFNLKTDRDYYQLYLLTFLSMLAATSLSIEIEMFYFIILYVVLFFWNILSITLVKIWNKSDTPEPFPFSFFSFRYWALVIAGSFVMFLFGLGIFYILPRTQLGYFGGRKAGETQHVSGFSQKVQLGDIAQIQENRGEVMRVRVTSPFPLGLHHFYWRGSGFDRWDGKSWSSQSHATNMLMQDTTNNLYATANNVDPTMLVKQEIYLKPIDSHVIFGQDRIIKLDGNFFGVSRDVNNTLVGMGVPEHYDVYSLITRLTPDQLRARKASFSENLKRYYTKLDHRDAKIEDLANRITQGATNMYDAVLMVQRYLEKNYRYTTSNLPMSETDPVSTFLFTKKEGHCEYFATSMVVLLRSVGIPCRLVNGFLEGEFNEIGDFYVVRQSDAHTWVEVYFGSGTWVTFDPSAREVVAGEASSSFWKMFNPRKILDSISFFWDRYILIFSAQDQIDFLSAIRDQYHQIKRSVRHQTKSTGKGGVRLLIFVSTHRLLLGFVTVFALFGWFAVLQWRKRRERLQLLQSPVLFYQQMLTHLQKRGFEKPVASTPAEFAQQVGNLLPNASNDVTSITDLFYKARFGNYRLNSEDFKTIESALARLEEIT